MIKEGAGYERLREDELIAAIRAEDRGAFEWVYRQYAAKLYASAYNLLRDRQACEDIVQELFINFWIKRESLRIDRLRPYLYAAARNGVLMAIRSGRAHLDESAMDELAAAYRTDDKLLHGEVSALVERSIDTLPKKCREIFVLSRKEHLSNKEIAERLNISTKTVEAQITIALRKMRLEMGDYVTLAAVVTCLLQ